MQNDTHIATYGSRMNIHQVFSGQVGGVELGHEVVGVGVLVGALLVGGRYLLHVVTYAEKFS